MKNETLFFCEAINEEMAYTKTYLIDEMKERGLFEVEVSIAVRELKTNYFYCRALGEVLIKGKGYDPCGKECDDYDPRNGKSGCCKHRGLCYIPGAKYRLTVDGKLKPFILLHNEIQ